MLDPEGWVFLCDMSGFVSDTDIYTLSPGDAVTFPNGQSGMFTGPGLYSEDAMLSNTSVSMYDPAPDAVNVWSVVDSDSTTALIFGP